MAGKYSIRYSVLSLLMIKKGFVLFLLALMSVFISCSNTKEPADNWLQAPVCTAPFIPKAYDRQVVGFYPAWKEDILPVSAIQWEKLTRIIYAFALPESDGTINTSELISARQLADSAHAHGVEVYLSVGGAEGSVNFPVLAMDPESRGRFIKEVRQFIFENCYDGVDIDWEYFSGYANNVVVPAESNALVALVRDLKAGLSPYSLGISIDLGATDWGGKHFPNAITAYVDDLMVMSYDFTGTWSDPGPHSSYADAIGSGNTSNSTGIAYWVNYRGWPKEHILLGVPFYGKDFDVGGGNYIAYRDILLQHPDAYDSDMIDNLYYNGIKTIEDKTRYVLDNGLSGVMIWEIAQDSQVDSVSLLSSIHNVLHP